MLSDQRAQWLDSSLRGVFMPEFKGMNKCMIHNRSLPNCSIQEICDSCYNNLKLSI